MPLYQEVRPQTFEEVLGNEGAVEQLRAQLAKPDRPHSYLLHGQTGGGKTTLARICAKELGADELSIREINAADTNGVATAREIIEQIQYIPPGGGALVYIVDECHMATANFWTALLKPLEDTPRHVYFFLCTTHKSKVLTAVQNRCQDIAIEPLDERTLYKLVFKTAKKKGIDISKDVLQKIAEYADGSARNALTSLESCIGMDDEEKMLEVIKSSDALKATTIELCRALIAQKEDACQRIVADLKGEEPEKVRRTVLGYCQSILLKNFKGKTAPWAAHIMECFIDPFYDSGYAGLVLSVYQAFEGPEED